MLVILSNIHIWNKIYNGHYAVCFRVFIGLYIVLLYDNQYSCYGDFTIIFITFSFFYFLKTVERLSNVCTLFYYFKPKDNLILLFFINIFQRYTSLKNSELLLQVRCILQNLQGRLEDLSRITLESTKKF